MMLKTIVPQPHSDPSSATEDYSRSPSPGLFYETGNTEKCDHPTPLAQNKTPPAISLIRPSRVSSSVNPRVLNHLRRRFAENTMKLRCEHLEGAEGDGSIVKDLLSHRESPNFKKPQRAGSLKGLKTKLCRVSSDGVKNLGYEPIPTYFEDIWLTREKITSVNRAISGNNLSTSQRHYRPRSLIPATNRIIHFDSSDESEGENSLDFGLYDSLKFEVSQTIFSFDY